MSELKTKWPVWVDDPNQHDYENEIDYHSARADAAIERLRLAETLLKEIAADELTPYPNEYGGIYADAAKDVLAAIGPIPGGGE